MYRLNELKRNVLITPDEVIFHGPTDHTLDRRKIIGAIIIAEERFIKPALTYDLYKAIVNQKNKKADAENIGNLKADAFTGLEAENWHLPEEDLQDIKNNLDQLRPGDILNASEFLDSNNLTLWEEHLWKLTAECVLFIAMPTMYVQFASAGIIHSAPTSNGLNAAGAVTPELGAVKFMMDRFIMDRIDPLLGAMKEFICLNLAGYTGYRGICACANEDTELTHKRTTYITGLYDDETNCGRCW